MINGITTIEGLVGAIVVTEWHFGSIGHSFTVHDASEADSIYVPISGNPAEWGEFFSREQDSKSTNNYAGSLSIKRLASGRVMVQSGSIVAVFTRQQLDEVATILSGLRYDPAEAAMQLKELGE
jgi:hypothetical protein